MPEPSMESVHGYARVLGMAPAAEGMFLLRLEIPEIQKRARPGQFVMLGPIPGEDLLDPFLNRPFTIHRVLANEVWLLIAMIGRGTRLLGAERMGRSIGILGPLGRGFAVPPGADPIFLVGGGAGVAPLFFLAEWLTARGQKAILVYGVPSLDRVVSTEVLTRGNTEVHLATDNGTTGFHGNAVELLGERLAGFDPARLGSAYLAACGPEPMMQAAVVLSSQAGIKTIEVSLESHMACGRGACLGCTVFFPDGNGRRVCCDGPVFDGREVFRP